MLNDREPFISTGCYSRCTVEDASAEIKSFGEALIDLTSIKTEQTESSYRIFTSTRADGYGGLNSLTKPNPHESGPDRARSISLQPQGWSLQRRLSVARGTIRARVVSRTCLEQLAPLSFSRHMGLKLAPAIS